MADAEWDDQANDRPASPDGGVAHRGHRRFQWRWCHRSPVVGVFRRHLADGQISDGIAATVAGVWSPSYTLSDLTKPFLIADMNNDGTDDIVFRARQPIPGSPYEIVYY